jgi:glycosyltransferase involved in cell wall biosynthesis
MAQPSHGAEEIELSIVMPCLNEARTLGACISKAMSTLREHRIVGEVVVADNGSTDGSQEIARQMGARVVEVEARGYGAATMAGVFAAEGEFVIMGDADESYDFTDLMPFVERLREVSGTKDSSLRTSGPVGLSAP